MGGNTAIGDGYDIAWKLADVLAGVAGPGLLDSYQAERLPYAEQVVIRSLHNAKERVLPSLDLSDIPEPLDHIGLGFGFRCRSAAVLADDDDPALTEGPTNPTGRPGFRAPHVSIVVGDTGCPLWICDGEWQCAAVDLPVQVLPARRRPVGTDGRLATRTASVPSTPAIRPDGVVA
jgi:hypothetical protein